MIGNVQGTQGMFGGQWTQPSPLTDDQKAQVQSILSGFDPKNLTCSDTQAIFQSLQQASIGPSPDLRSTLANDGFNLH